MSGARFWKSCRVFLPYWACSKYHVRIYTYSRNNLCLAFDEWAIVVSTLRVYALMPHKQHSAVIVAALSLIPVASNMVCVGIAGVLKLKLTQSVSGRLSKAVFNSFHLPSTFASNLLLTFQRKEARCECTIEARGRQACQPTNIWTHRSQILYLISNPDCTKHFTTQFHIWPVAQQYLQMESYYLQRGSRPFTYGAKDVDWMCRKHYRLTSLRMVSTLVPSAWRMFSLYCSRNCIFYVSLAPGITLFLRHTHPTTLEERSWL